MCFAGCTTMCLKKQKHYTLLSRLLNTKTCDSLGKGLYVWIAYGLNFQMTPTSPKIIHDWVSTVHFCYGYEN